MPAEAYQDEIELDVEVLEAVPLTSKSPEEHRSSFPFPWLERTGKRKLTRFRAVVLENALLRVTILPELGGRIFGIADKRTGVEILDPNPYVQVTSGGPRGVSLTRGIQWSPSADRLKDIGPVDYQIVEPSDSDDAAGVWMAELEPDSTLSVHFGVTLAADAAQIALEMRTFNRSLLPATASPQVTIQTPNEDPLLKDCRSLYDAQSDTGITIDRSRGEVSSISIHGNLLRVGRFDTSDHELSGRQLDSWSVSLLPFSALGGFTASAKGVALYLAEDSISIQSSQRFSSLKLLLRLANGHTMEAPLELYPEQIARLDISELTSKPVGIIVIDSGRNEILRWLDEPEPARESGPMFGTSLLNDRALRVGVEALFDGKDPTDPLTFASTNLGSKSAAQAALGIFALRSGTFSEGAEYFEDALLFNGEDHLTWWMRSLALRLSGESGVDSPELLNAHFLAPLEPTLRAESFLALPQQGKEPSALLKPLSDNPDAFLEVACQLHDCGLYSELSRWIDEALRHHKNPMLHYILADALARGSRMSVEAAQHVSTAAKAPINPPYPWRATERRVLESLSGQFPGDVRIRELLDLIDWRERAEGRTRP